MGLYYSIFFVLFALSYVRRGRNKWLFWGSIFFLILMAGLRDYSIGTDTMSYKEIFDYLHQREPLWTGMNIVVKVLGGNYTDMLIVSSVLTMVPLGIAMRRSSVNPQYSLFFYYGVFGYLNSYNGMRQFVAISFVMLAYTYYQKNKIKCILLILIASGFHASAVIAFAIFLLPLVKFTKKNVFLLLPLTFCLGFLFNDSLFNLLLGKYAGYLKSDDTGYRDNIFVAAVMALMMDMLFVWIYQMSKVNAKKYLWTKIFFIGILMVNLTFQLVLGARIILYFTMAQIFVFPYFLRFNKERAYGIPTLLIFLYCLVIFTKILLASQGDLVPYKTASY